MHVYEKARSLAKGYSSDGTYETHYSKIRDDKFLIRFKVGHRTFYISNITDVMWTEKFYDLDTHERSYVVESAVKNYSAEPKAYEDFAVNVNLHMLCMAEYLEGKIRAVNGYYVVIDTKDFYVMTQNY